ncbi:MAG TPA: TIGR03435 family protein [Terracidiphilus sp.]|nr:TIGR03435 family protein [Terracidiphilus sp.]
MIQSRIGKNLLVGLALILAFTFAKSIKAAPPQAAPAQAAPANTNQDIVGTWQGTLHAGRDLRTVLKVTKDDKGAYKADLYSIDQGGAPIAAKTVTFQDRELKYAIPQIGGSYDGKMSSDGNTIEGTWTQYDHPLPLTITRATPETEWTIPKPPPPVPPMAADANPTFEVATIKPSKPGQPGIAFLVQGRRFKTINTPLTSIIAFADEVQPNQVIGLPDWAGSEKFDIEAVPDGTGQPSQAQWKSMVQKLLASRFGLKFHPDKKVLPVYVLTVAKGGEKMSLDTSNPNGLPGLFFHGLGKLGVRNATMHDFTNLMQSAVLDRPVIDMTELKGKYDFELDWTPDESQFVNMGVHVPPPSADATNLPPSLYTAIEEQLGLKLEATKGPADVMIIDHVDHPTAN